jgi:hypothetical protein
VPAWYTRGEARCRRDAQWFFDLRNLESWSAQDALKMEHDLREGFRKSTSSKSTAAQVIIYQRTGARHEFPTELPNTRVDHLPNKASRARSTAMPWLTCP